MPCFQKVLSLSHVIRWQEENNAVFILRMLRALKMQTSSLFQPKTTPVMRLILPMGLPKRSDSKRFRV